MREPRRRRHSNPSSSDEDPAADYRDAFERDCDRILYSSAFRRLNGVTQVVSAAETLLFHNRLTHSLKVSQVGRRLAEWLIAEGKATQDGDAAHSVDPAAAAAAALAHDLGHPPFGHIAEKELAQLCGGIGSFEGNAQSFRIVTKLSVRKIDTVGLDLTKRTLRGILKYPWLRDGEHRKDGKWGAYATETNDFDFAVDGQDHVDHEPGNAHSNPPKSLEAEIMDWADDITYAVHDLEDFYRAGITPIPQLSASDSERELFVVKASADLQTKDEFDQRKLVKALEYLLNNHLAFDGPYTGSREDRSRLNDLASVLITRFIEGTDVWSRDGAPQLRHDPDVWHEVNILKQMTWHYVIDDPNLATIQEGQKAVIHDVFEYLVEWATKEKSWERLPTRFRSVVELLREDSEAAEHLGGKKTRIFRRAAADYISSLTEAQVLELHGRLTGNSQASVMHTWLTA